MIQSALKLVNDTPATDGGSLRFEQRRSKRHSVSGRATAVTKVRVPEGQQSRIRSLQLLDISDTGLGAICQDSFDLGSTIAVFLPPHGADQGFDIYGRIVRCVPNEYGNTIGIEFASRLAA